MTRVKDETRNVVKRTKAATIKSLARASAFIRGVAQRSLGTGINKKTGKFTPSKPGKPPRSPTLRLRNAIFFNVDRLKTSSVIGPVQSVIGRIGNTHEFGGIEPPKAVVNRGGHNFRLKVGGHGPMRAAGKVIEGVGRLATEAQVMRAKDIVETLGLRPAYVPASESKSRRYPPRPFMGPALIRSRDRIPQFWKNAIKRS